MLSEPNTPPSPYVLNTFELEATGAAFYDFPEIAKPKPYKDAYRIRLDSLPLTAEQKIAALEEVKAVFGFNGGIFAELASICGSEVFFDEIAAIHHILQTA